MMRLGPYLLAFAVVLAQMGINIWQHTKLQDLTARAERAEQSAAERLATIDQLRADAADREQANQELAATQQSMAAQLDAQQLRIRELKRENDQYRQWADIPLPDITRRLQQRPAFTGAGDYQQWLLSRGKALHTESSQPSAEP